MRGHRFVCEVGKGLPNATGRGQRRVSVGVVRRHAEDHVARPVRRRTPVLLASAVGVVVLAGCGGGGADQASPFPDRPADIDITTLDPCAALAPPQVEALGLADGTRGDAVVDGTAARDCTWLGQGDASNYGVQFVDLHAAAASEEPGSRILTVDGYGAVEGAAETNNGPGIPAFCQLAIDVSENQTVRIQVNNGRPRTGGDPASIRDVCREAEDAAGAVLTNIRS